MKHAATCSKCQSRDIIGHHRLHADQRDLSVDLPRISSARLEVFTCLNCGYTELFPNYIGFENIQRSIRKYSRQN